MSAADSSWFWSEVTITGISAYKQQIKHCDKVKIWVARISLQLGLCKSELHYVITNDAHWQHDGIDKWTDKNDETNQITVKQFKYFIITTYKFTDTTLKIININVIVIQTG